MLKSNGYILLDTIATLSIIFFVCMSLVPIWLKIENDRDDIQRQIKAHHVLYENLQRYILAEELKMVVQDATFSSQFLTSITPLDTNPSYVKGCVTYQNSRKEKIVICDVAKKRTGIYTR